MSKQTILLSSRMTIPTTTINHKHKIVRVCNDLFNYSNSTIIHKTNVQFIFTLRFHGLVTVSKAALNTNQSGEACHAFSGISASIRNRYTLSPALVVPSPFGAFPSSASRL
jgi:hypothetical protein